MPEVHFFSAFIGGLLTFLAPCTLPLIPAYIAYIGGARHGEEKNNLLRRTIFVNAVFYTLGFSVVFILFGLASGALGTFLVLYRARLSAIGGVFVILFGLSLLGVLPPLFRAMQLRLPQRILPGSKLAGFVLGVFFGLGWTPCIGPILGTILILAGTSGTALDGGALLLVYSFGLALPFLLVALLYGRMVLMIPRLTDYLPLITKIGGFCLLLIGVLLVVGQLGTLSGWIATLTGELGVDRLSDFM
jgi:cytochrome c-type biogenesis protein